MRKTNRCVLIAVVIALSHLGSSPSLFAETPSEIARRHFEEGSKHFQLGEFDKAIDEYKAGYKAKPDPMFLYNIGQAYRLKNDFQNALFFYRSYLSTAPNADNRAAVEDRMRKLEVEIERQHKLATMPPTDAVAPGATPKTVAPRPTESNAGATPQTQTAAAPGATATGVAPEPTANAEAALTAKPAAEKPRRRSVAKAWWLWTAVGVVAVGAAVGVGVGVSTASGRTPPPASGLGTVSF
jgi:tetratricopeptide (TPR) repeat protein